MRFCLRFKELAATTLVVQPIIARYRNIRARTKNQFIELYGLRISGTPFVSFYRRENPAAKISAHEAPRGLGSPTVRSFNAPPPRTWRGHSWPARAPQSRVGSQSLRRCSGHAKGVLVTLRCARRKPAVHPAAAVPHRRRLAPVPAPCPRSTPPAEVHGRFALHGVDPLISIDPHPNSSGQFSNAGDA
jgi:hypothetical protein